MHCYRLKAAYLANGWSRDVFVTVADDGFISEVGGGVDAAKTAAAVEYIDGIVVPGMPNAHSHSFQRAMAGDTEYRLSSHDSFWTWRQSMYALANRLEPDDLQVVATQVYVEMLKAGYTSVAEFHYLHRQRDGRAYEAHNALWDAVTRAAGTAGIGLTFLPTLYQSSDFGGKPLRSEQERFALTTPGFVRAVEARVADERRLGSSLRRTGVAFHSLRAVPLDQLRDAAAALRGIDPKMPLHIHVAEQTLEVEACLRETGRRPVELLLDTGLLDEHWCLVHATHVTPQEIKGIAYSRAAVCVSITTEANLGDGFFDAANFLEHGGRLCIGSDSQATVDPAEELRWLEYQQRLGKRRRGVLAAGDESHVGTVLWREAAAQGGVALGQAIGGIAAGQRADWIVLDGEHAAFAGGSLDTALDRLVFAGGAKAIRDVMVAGRWVIENRRHAEDERLRSQFGALLARLGAR